MRIGFFVNDVKTEQPGYTTIRLAMGAVNLGHEIWIMGADGSDPHPVIEDDYDNIHPSWGPVSDHFVFSSNRSGNYEIWISDLDGSDLVQVTDDPYSDIYPAWNPSKGWIAFSSNRDDDGGSNYDIFGIDTPDY